MKVKPRQGQIRILREKGLDFRLAKILIDGIQRSGIDGRHFGSMARSNQIPKDTADWLAGLSQEERARLRILGNEMADSLFSTGKGWVRFKAARHIMTGTFIAYPEPGMGMPRKIEFIQKGETGTVRRHVFYSKSYEGLRGAALVFDDPAVHDRVHRGTREPMSIYEPKGKVALIKDYLSGSGWYLNDHDPQMLAPLVEQRYVSRLSPSAWFGPIVRSAFKVFTSYGAVSEPRNHEGNKLQKKSLYVGYDPTRSVFGVLIELPGEPLRECREAIITAHLKERPGEAPVLSTEAMREIYGILSARTIQFIGSPSETARLPDEDLVGRFHGIGHGNPSWHEALRSEVSEVSYWQYLQLSRSHTLDEWHSTYSRLCSALGVPTLAQKKG